MRTDAFQMKRGFKAFLLACAYMILGMALNGWNTTFSLGASVAFANDCPDVDRFQGRIYPVPFSPSCTRFWDERVKQEPQGIASKWNECVDSALSGAPQDQFSIALSYMSGHAFNGSPDLSKAVKWLNLAASQDYAPAEFWLGLAYCRGHGVTKDLTKAFKYFEISATKGVRNAQATLAHFFYNRGSDQNDFESAAKWYRRLIDVGGKDFPGVMTSDRPKDPWWYLRLSEIHCKGRGVSSDADYGFQLAAQALEHGDTPEVKEQVAWIYNNGDCGSPDYGRAYELFISAGDIYTAYADKYCDKDEFSTFLNKVFDKTPPKNKTNQYRERCIHEFRTRAATMFQAAQSAQEMERRSPNLDRFKIQCEELGFTPGTEKFGECVLTLSK